VWNGRFSSRQDSADGFSKDDAIELESAGQIMKIEEILNPAVSLPKDDQGFEFFRNDGLRRIGENRRMRKIQKDGIIVRLGRRPNEISGADIDLEPQSRASAASGQNHAKSSIFIFGSNFIDPERGGIEDDTIRFDFGGADHLNIGSDVILRSAASPQKIQIARRPAGPIRPQTEQHSALENQSLSPLGLSEAVEKPFITKNREKPLKLFAGLSRSVEKKRQHGSGQIQLLLFHFFR